MKHTLLTTIFILVSSTLFAFDCSKYLEETIKPLEFRGTVLNKKVDAKTKIYSIEIKKEDNKIIFLELIINKSSTELFNFSKVKSMIKKEKNSCHISIATPIDNGSIEVNRFTVTCE